MFRGVKGFDVMRVGRSWGLGRDEIRGLGG